MTRLVAWLLLRWQYVLIAALVAAVGAQQVRVSDAQAAEAKVARMFAQYLANTARAKLDADTAERAEETRREAEKERIVRDAQAQIESARAAAAGAVRAADGLREQVARAVARKRAACPNPKPAERGAGESGADALDVLAGLLDRHSRELVEVGDHADRLRITGLACEAFADQLRGKL